MKKYIGLLILSVFLSTTVLAEWTDANCTNRGGKIITGVNNSLKFCQSAVTMNWWSAHAWCKAHNGQLADAQNICLGTPLSGNEAACRNVNNSELYTLNSRISWLKNTLDSDGQVDKIAVLYKGAYEAFLQWKPLSSLAYAVCE